MPAGEISLQEPPTLPEPPSGNLMMLITALPMALASGAMMLMFTGGGSNNGMMIVVAGMMAVGMLGMTFGQVGRSSSARKSRMKGERRDYLRYLGQTRKKVRAMAVGQRDALAWVHPDPAALWSVAKTRRLW